MVCSPLALLKLEEAWQAALELDERPCWLALSGKAMEMLNVELATRVYRKLGKYYRDTCLPACSSYTPLCLP